MVESWLVYRLTNSAFWLGIISFCSQGCAFLLAPLAGVIVDRTDRRRLLIRIQTVAMIQSFVLASLVFTHVVQVWHIAMLAMVLGSCNSFEITTRHAFTVDMVGLDDLPSALALNSVTMHGARMIGPVLAGIIMSVTGPGGEGWCFLANGMSFLFVLWGLFSMDPSRLRTRALEEADRETGVRGLIHQFAVAVHYTKRVPKIRRIMLFATFLTFFGFPYTVLLPVVSKSVLGGNASTFAWLMAGTGVGAVFGAFRHGGDKSPRDGLRWILLGDLAGLGVGYLFIGASTHLLLSMLGAAAIGFFLMGAFPIMNTTVQRNVADSMRGRVLALYTMTFLGAAPLGNLFFGSMIDLSGVRIVSFGTATICIGTAVAIAVISRRSSKKRGAPDSDSPRPRAS